MLRGESVLPLPPGGIMIELTALSGKKLWVNPHQIETLESKPDTTLIFVYGKTMVVMEKPEEVVARIVAYRRTIASFAGNE
jgi:flagellar protein FlbD